MGGGWETYRPVDVRRGQTALTRMLLGPYSAARPLVAFGVCVSWLTRLNVKRVMEDGGRAVVQTFDTAALEALYHTNPGLGRVAPIDEMLITLPPVPWLIRFGMKCRAAKKMDLTFTAKTLSNSSSVTSAVGCCASV